MKSLILFSTAYGNTEKIAREIGKALESRGTVQVVNVQEMKAELLQGIDLLVVG